MTSKKASSPNVRRDSVSETLKDWYSGLTVGMYHSCWYAKDLVIAAVVRPVQRALGTYNPKKETKVLQRLAKLKEGEKPTLKVIGIGFGRTGTVSSCPYKIHITTVACLQYLSA